MSGPIFLASSNAGKLRELVGMASGSGVGLAALPGFADIPPASEDFDSFALNAIEKAEHYSFHSRHTDHANAIVLADDSGLVVDALGGAPGVRSARYAGPTATDADNNARLMAELDGIPGVLEGERTARYICVLALARNGKLLAVVSDKCEGLIISDPRGDGGFGYDPYFFFPPLKKTLAEVSEEEKNQVSHRGKAFRKLIEYLTKH